MKFFLQRDGRTYGPYSYDDLKRYQSENRIGPTDQVRREDPPANECISEFYCSKKYS